MSNIFNNYTQHRVFMIYGNLGDMFVAGDLIPGTFDHYLMKYLKSLGFKHVVFFSPNDKGRYVLDDESAAFLMERNIKSEIPASRKNRGRINPFNRNVQESKTEEPSENENNSVKTEELRYKYRNINVHDFLSMAQSYMTGEKGKTAVVVTNLQSFLLANPDSSYQALISGDWVQYTKNQDAGAFIFLAPNATASSIQNMLDGSRMPFITDYFFEEGSTGSRAIRCDRTLYIGEPQKDEIRNLLEYMRIAGFRYQGRKLHLYIDESEMEQITDSVFQCCKNKENYPRQRNLSQLSGVYDYLAEYVYRHCCNHLMAKGIRFNVKQAKKLFGSGGEDWNVSALDKLNKSGWEPVYKKVSKIVGVVERKQRSRKKTEDTDSPILVFEETEEQEQKVETPVFYGSKRLDPELGGEAVQDTKSRPEVPSFALMGNPGVGKTTVARLIASALYEAGILRTANTIEVTRKDLVGQYIGHTEAVIKDYIARAEEGVLFIDEAYELFAGEDNSRDFGKHVVEALLPVMDKKNTKHHVCVILAGYTHEMEELIHMNSGIESRIGDNKIEIPDATPELMTAKFLDFIKQEGFELSEAGSEKRIPIEIFFKNVYKHRNTRHFGNYRTVREIADNVVGNAILRDAQDGKIILEDFKSYEKYFETKGVSTAEEAIAQLDQFVGMKAVKEKMLQVWEDVKLEEAHKKEGIAPIATSKHYIFSGNPGTGKTSVGKIMGQLFYTLGALGAEETKFVDGSELIGSRIGQGTSRAKKMIQDAIDNRQLLFIDEAYQIMDTAYRDEIMGAFLNPLTEHAGDFKVVFALYRNRVREFLDLNAGNTRRFDIIEFPDYTAEEMLEIFERKREQIGRNITEEAKEQVSQILRSLYENRTEGFGNAAVPLDLLNDMERNRFRRVQQGMEVYEDEKELTKEDIPEKYRLLF